MRSDARKAQVAAPMALVGLAGGMLAARMFGPLQGIPGPLIVITTVVMATLLGLCLVPRPGRNWVARAIGGTVLAGVANALLLLVLINFHDRDAAVTFVTFLPAAIWFGAIFALPFVPAALWVAGASRVAGRARSGSLVDGVDRRAGLRATAGSVAIGAGLAGVLLRHLSTTALGVAVAATVLGIALLAIDLRATARLGSLAARVTRRGDPARLGIGAPTIDLGLGAEVYEQIAVARDPYREADRVLVRVHGDPAWCRAALARALRTDVVLLIVGIAASACLALA